MGQAMARIMLQFLSQGAQRRLRARLALPMIALACAGCAAQAPIEPGIANIAPNGSMGQSEYIATVGASYLLRPADKVSVTVFREAELSLPEVVISAEGRISVPLVGPIQAAGMTVEQLETRIEELYDARYLRSPDVAVNVVDYGSHVVTVEGSVTESGLFNFRPGTRLSGGIALAKGPTRVADVREVAVFRQSGSGILIAKFDYAQVRAGGMMDPVLQPGDRIVVGTDNLSQTWQDFLRALPAFGMFAQF
jgi:polysaccharide export outer membrane protein